LDRLNKLYDDERQSWNNFRKEHIALERELQAEINKLKQQLTLHNSEVKLERMRASRLEEENRRLRLQMDGLRARLKRTEDTHGQHRELLNDKHTAIEQHMLKNQELELKLADYKYLLQDERNSHDQRKTDMIKQREKHLDAMKKHQQQAQASLSELQEQQQNAAVAAPEPAPKVESLGPRSQIPDYSNINCGWASGAVKREDILVQTDFKGLR
jgi:hypothetical protein